MWGLHGHFRLKLYAILSVYAESGQPALGPLNGCDSRPVEEWRSAFLEKEAAKKADVSNTIFDCEGLEFRWGSGHSQRLHGGNVAQVMMCSTHE